MYQFFGKKNESRIEAGRKIADILGVGKNIDYRLGSLCSLPLDSNEANVVY
jgi:hypothetical protein